MSDSPNATVVRSHPMRHRISLLLAALSFPLASAMAAGSPPASAVMAFADAHGEQAALAEFFSCGSSGQRSYSQVAQGSPAWLSVAVRLLPAADACVSESLHDALARALVRVPNRVLPLVNTTPALSSHAICVPFLAAEEPASQSVSYLRHEMAVLRAVQSRALEPAKQACLAEVTQALAAIER